MPRTKSKKTKEKTTKEKVPKSAKQKRQTKESVENIKNAENSKIKTNAPETQYFILCNGHAVKNIKELADVMENIEDHVFNHHVTDEKHDFAQWVKDVFHEIDLAENLAKAKDKKNMQLVIYKHIAHNLW